MCVCPCQHVLVRVCVYALAVHVCGIVLTSPCLKSSGGRGCVRRLFIHHLSIVPPSPVGWCGCACCMGGRGEGGTVRDSAYYLVPLVQVVIHLDSGLSSSACECLLRCMAFMYSGLCGEFQVSLFCYLSALPSCRPVTHGCIIGTVRLWINDKEQLGYATTLLCCYSYLLRNTAWPTCGKMPLYIVHWCGST